MPYVAPGGAGDVGVRAARRRSHRCCPTPPSNNARMVYGSVADRIRTASASIPIVVHRQEARKVIADHRLADYLIEMEKVMSNVVLSSAGRHRCSPTCRTARRAIAPMFDRCLPELIANVIDDDEPTLLIPKFMAGGADGQAFGLIAVARASLRRRTGTPGPPTQYPGAAARIMPSPRRARRADKLGCALLSSSNERSV